MAAGGGVDFAIGFNDPLVPGDRFATVSIASNDDDENPYTFNIKATGTGVPKINVQGNGVDIADNDTFPGMADGTEFGSANIADSTVSRTFIVQNTGNEVLVLGGVGGNTAEVIGPHSKDFTITALPEASVAAKAETSITVEFNPSNLGERIARVSITSNDESQNLYTFDIKGTGTAPEISVLSNGVRIRNSDATPDINDHTDFGAISLMANGISKTFTIHNEGTGPLNLDADAVTLSNPNGGPFTVTRMPTRQTIEAGESISFTITFLPTDAGEQTETVSIASDDADENIYTFTIRALGIGEPEIVVSRNGVDISNGDKIPDLGDGTDFGDANIADNGISTAFKVFNRGNGALTLGVNAVTLSGTNAAAFTATPITEPLVIPAGESTSITITFVPVIAGEQRATVSIASNDVDEGSFSFAIRGVGIGAPEVSVFGNRVEIADGDTIPDTDDGTDIGLVDLTSGPADVVFTIRNDGTDVLVLGNDAASLSGENAGDFAITAQPAEAVAAGDEASIVISFDPSIAGDSVATLSIANDDPDESPYTFAIRGTGTGVPEIRISGNGVGITNGDKTPSLADHTDFGFANITAETARRSFTIENAGSDVLAITSILLSGSNASDFSVISPPQRKIAVNESTVIEIGFDPSTLGDKTAVLTIKSNAASDFDFALKGIGTASGEITIVQKIIGPDIAVPYTSPTSALNFTLNTASGTAGITETVPVGMHVITAADTTGTGYGILSVACDDNDSTASADSRAASINLSSDENVTCTFTLIEAREHTSKLIADYLGARNTLLLAHQPGTRRRLERLEKGTGGTVGSVSGYGLQASTFLPANLSVNAAAYSFDTSLKTLTAAYDPAGHFATESRWDIWLEGHLADFSDDTSRGGTFGVVYSGVDYLITPKILGGVMIQYDWLDQDTGLSDPHLPDEASIDGRGWMVGPYGTVKFDRNFYLDIRMAWGRSDNTISPFGTYTDTFDTERWLVSAALIGEYQIRNWTIRPGATLQYIGEHQFGYTDDFGVAIPSQDFAQGDLRIGPRVDYAHSLSSGVMLSPWIELDTVYSLFADDQFSSGSFVSEINGLTGSFKGGLAAKMPNNLLLEFSGQYDGIGVSVESYGGTLRTSVPF